MGVKAYKNGAIFWAAMDVRSASTELDELHQVTSLITVGLTRLARVVDRRYLSG